MEVDQDGLVVLWRDGIETRVDPAKAETLLEHGVAALVDEPDEPPVVDEDPLETDGWPWSSKDE